MNLFLVALSRDPIEATSVTSALQNVASRVPYFSGAPLFVHSSADRRLVAAWISHPPERMGGIHYTAVRGDKLALFSGRPILVTEKGFDGRAALDPSLYLQPHSDWDDRLDGRFAVVQCDGGRQMTVTTDPLGSYQVFTAAQGDMRWVGNNAKSVALAAGASQLDMLALASVLTFGWSFEGRPTQRAVHRLAPNATHTFRDTAWLVKSRPDIMSAVGTKFDARKAAQVLVGVTNALMDWPDRPITVSVTGGRDSRLTFAAAASGSHNFRAKTRTWPHEAGFPESADVRVARQLCEIAGLSHTTELGDPVGDVRRSAQMLSILASGTVSMGDVGTPPAEMEPGPLELQVTGAGGEIGRCYYGLGFKDAREASDAVCKHHVHMIPAPVVDSSGVELVRRWVGEWMVRRADEGIAVSALGDAFYVQERSASWASATHGTLDYWADTVSPLWSASLLPLMLACPGWLRRRDGFHNLVLRELAPDLWRVSFAGNIPRWTPLQRRRLHSDQVLAAYRKLRLVWAELLRRVELRRRHDAVQKDDPIVDAQKLARELAWASPGHAAWELLDHKRVKHTLEADPRTMHPRSRHLVWRLLAVFEP